MLDAHSARPGRTAPRRRGPLGRSALGAGLLAALVAGCASTEKGTTRKGLTEDELAAYRMQIAELGDRPVVIADAREPGVVLTEIDNQIQRWNELLLSSQPGDQRKRRSVEEQLRVQGRNHFDLLEASLIDGTERNRTIAAAALGFAADDRATGALMVALDDSSLDVVDAALLGLGLLADPKTPMEPIARKLEQSSEGWTRNNAAYAVKRLLEAGAPVEPVQASLRLALLDSWDSVRAQAAATLMVVGERKDVTPLRDALYDPAAMVAMAAAKAIRRIAQKDDTARGEAARALFDAWQEREGRAVRATLMREMALLANRNFGDETEQWREWAYGLP